MKTKKSPLTLIKIYVILLLCSSFALSASAFSNKNYERIVVSGGSITEIIYALNQQKKIVGVDSTSSFPLEAKSKPQIGYVRKVSVEGILSLNPDLLLGEADTGPKKVLNQLKQTGLKHHIFTKTDNFENIEEKIAMVANFLGAKKQAERLINALKPDREALKYILKQIDKKTNVIFILSLNNKQPIVAGKGTSADEVLLAAGGNNLANQYFDGWKPLSAEASMSMNPDVIIIMNRHGSNAKVNFEKLASFKLSNAVKNNRVHTFDGSSLLGMGPRTPKTVVELAQALHPSTVLPSNYSLADRLNTIFEHTL